MTVKRVIVDKDDNILGYVVESEEGGSFFIQSKRTLVERCVNYGINARYMNTDRIMRSNRSVCG